VAVDQSWMKGKQKAAAEDINFPARRQALALDCTDVFVRPN
jgi:hypothetical protein